MNLMDLFIKVGVDDQATSAIGKITNAVGTGLATAAKVGVAAVSAAATGVVALTKASIDSYAEYEQLVGGVETLYGTEVTSIEEYAKSVGKSADEVGHEYEMMMNRQNAVMENAANAYQTAGMSANEYMETVTGFAASLTSSLGEYEWEAAGYADMIVTDMADNANKMGTSMESIQYAYQGFAKQNYTMLDNLKLGYGGTKEEMERLLRDAEKYGGLVEGSLKIESFADVADAIHIVQEEMGITGTTAKEAGTTIQGSVSSMKAAWKNLVTGLADENANFDELIDNLVTSLVGDGTETNLGVLGNIMPAIERALGGIGKVIEKAAPIIAEKLPAIANDILPSLLSAAVSLFDGLVAALPGIAQVLIDQAPMIIMSIVNAFIELLPQVIELGMQLIVSLANGITASLPQLIPTIVDVVLQIVNALTNPETLSNLLNAAMMLVSELAKGLIEAAPQLIDAAIQLVMNLIDFILDENNLNSIIDAALEIILAVSEGLIEAIPQLVDAAIQIIEKLCEFVLDPDNIAMLIDMALKIIVAIVDGLAKATGELVKGTVELIGKFIEVFAKTDWMAIGKNIVNGVWNGLKAAWGGLKKWFTNAWDGLVGGVKNLLGIHSPSRVFAGIGQNMALGVGEGWDYGFGDVKKGIENSMSFDTGTIGANSAYANNSGSGIAGNTFRDVIINIDGARYSDEQALAEAVAEKLQSMMDRRTAVYA